MQVLYLFKYAPICAILIITLRASRNLNFLIMLEEGF
jgi:hypothetical protein